MLDSKHMVYSCWHQLEWKVKYLLQHSAGSGARTLCTFTLHLLIYFYFNKNYQSTQWALEWTPQNSVIKQNVNDLKKVSRAPTTFRLSEVGIIKGNTVSKLYSYVHVRFWTSILVLRADFNHTPSIQTRWLGQAQLGQWSSVEVTLGDMNPRKGCQCAWYNPQFHGNGIAEAFKKQVDSWLHCRVCFTKYALWHRPLCSKIITCLL